SDEAPMGANDLVDVAATMQEHHVVADVSIRRRRSVINGPLHSLLQRHLDTATETRGLIRRGPQGQSAYVLLHDCRGCQALLRRKKSQQTIDAATLPTRNLHDSAFSFVSDRIYNASDHSYLVLASGTQIMARKPLTKPRKNAAQERSRATVDALV